MTTIACFRCDDGEAKRPEIYCIPCLGEMPGNYCDSCNRRIEEGEGYTYSEESGCTYCEGCDEEERRSIRYTR